MRTALSITLAVTAAATTAAPAQTRGALAQGTLAITGVNVVPMTRDTVLRDVTVLVRDGRIAEIGSGRSVRVPADARRVDGRGRYLIPGLADMHTHLYSDGDTPDSVAPDELGIMLANGVTTTRLMMGTPEQIALRAAVQSGRVLGPQLWLASPEFAGRRYGGEGFRGYAVPTPDSARAAVNAAADAGYDFIKITLFVQPGAYDALIDEARRRNIRVTGHVSPEVGVPRALAAGQQIEHLDNYAEQVLHDSAPSRQGLSDRGVYRPAAWLTMDHVDDAKVERIAGATARAGVYVTPTLTIFKKAFAIGHTEAELHARPDWRLIPPDVRSLYTNAMNRYWTNPPAERHRARWVALRDRLTKAIVDSGGRIMAGSDTPEFLFVYGYSLHRELESFVTAGLTPYQALVAATRNPAEYLGALNDFGTLERGKRADLVLLSANPLDDIRNTTRIEGVAVGGRWLERAELDRMVERASVRMNGAPM